LKQLLLLILVLIGLFPLYSAYPEKDHRTFQDKPFPNSSFIEIYKMKLHYRTWPAAGSSDSLPWILMVHGMGGSTFSWEYNAPVLAAAGFNVVAVDVPPFGYSDKNPDFNQSVDSRAALLWNFLDTIHPGSKWHLAGHSMGGGIVQCMVITNPGQVEKVVFADPALFSNLAGKNPYKMSILRFRPFEWIAVGIGNATMIKPEKIAKMLRSAYSREPNPVDVAEYYKALSQKGFARALIRSGTKSISVHPVDGKSFSKKAIALWGDRDTWMPLEKNSSLVNQIPSIKVIVIEGAGHCPMATHPELFNQYVLQFLTANTK
jgi:pimeloyl-ACP methyl ester carboxylesterase